MTTGDDEITGPGEGGVGETPVQVEIRTPSPQRYAETEDRQLQLSPHWRLRRLVIASAAFLALWFLMIAFIRTGTPASVYLILLLPFYAITLAFALRTPKPFRRPKAKTIRQRLTFTNKLSIAILTFVAIYIPFAFVSNAVIPYAPVVEFFLFILVFFALYRLIGRSVGVAPSLEALPPAAHRRHKQVVLPIDDPHYQRTLFLNFEFVDRGRGARQLAKRLESAMEAMGVDAGRRRFIVEDLEDYREGFHFGLGFTRTSRDRRRSRRDRRSQLLRSVYTKFNQELEQAT